MPLGDRSKILASAESRTQNILLYESSAMPLGDGSKKEIGGCTGDLNPYHRCST